MLQAKVQIYGTYIFTIIQILYMMVVMGTSHAILTTNFVKMLH